MSSKSYVYRFIDKNNKIIYIGKTNNLDKRYIQHFSKRGHLPKECYNSVWKIEYIKETSELNALLLETYYINKYRPKYNKLNKTYRPTSMNDTNLKDIKDYWKVYKIVNPALAPTKTELTHVKSFIFSAAAILFFISSLFIYLK